MEPEAQSKSLGQEVYTGTATFGRVYATIGAVIGVIIALILIFAGVAKLRDPHTQAVVATVTKVAGCAPRKAAKTTEYACVVDATFVVAKKTYTATNLSITRPAPLRTGETVTLRFAPGDPGGAVYEMAPRTAGWALVGLGALIGGVTTGIALLTYKYKGFAAVEGAVSAIGLLAR